MGAFDDLRIYSLLLDKGVADGALHYANMHDLKRYVNEPERTILVCHVPRRFNHLEDGVDMAVFGEVTIDFFLNGNIISKHSIFPLSK